MTVSSTLGTMPGAERRLRSDARVDDLLHALAEGPLGPYPMLEAAFGWNERRPAGWRQLGPGAPATDRFAGRYALVVETGPAEAATRLTRLLTTVTWPISTPAGRSESTRIAVPVDSYHRVLRALTGAWRDGRRILGTPSLAATHRPAALAIWRMAVLLGPPPADAGVLTVMVSTPAAAMLSCAASALALPHAVGSRGRRNTHLRVDRRILFRRLQADLERIPA